MTVLQGLTWDHRRAIDPLVSTLPGFRAIRPDVHVVWSRRSLHAFEFAPVHELAERFDLIVLDHPFAGEIAATQCLEPLDALIGAENGSSFVGPSLESYRYEGKTWAMPIDAACQIAVARPDLLASLSQDVPKTWGEMFDLGDEVRRHGKWLAIALKGVHSLMTFFTLCASLGDPCGTRPGERLFNVGTAREALAGMRRLLSYCPLEVLDWNSIALHDHMVGRDDLVYCPAVYCYATYAERDMRRPLNFYDLPGFATASPRGSTIGGSGLGVSAHSQHLPECLDYVRYLGTAATQKAFATHHGQPARLEAWLDPAIDRLFGNCYSNTLMTMSAAWIRPRYSGYLAFQASAGELIERHLRGILSETEVVGQLERLWETATGRSRAR
jgi:multiple sugar transport system substrate-binding protein